MIVLDEGTFWFRFRSIIQFLALWSMDEKAEAEPKTSLAKVLSMILTNLS